MQGQPIRVGVDIGGTFTDVALAHSGGLASAKVLTDYAAPEAAILEGIESAAAEAGVAVADIAQVIHGTTLVTNALIQRRGARTAFITTQGFRDVIEMRSENRFEQYDLNLVLPEPLVARRDRLVLAERLGPDGEVLKAPDEADIEALVDRVEREGYDAVAVGFLHAYANGAHERAVGAALVRRMPHLSVSLSHVVAPQMRELPRFNTVIANAYVQPQVARYLRRLVERLSQAGIGAPVYMMHSGGGIVSVETAIEQPVRLLESGPAGGAIFAADRARAHGLDEVLSFDMGGTTAKICLIENGTPKTANTFEVARSYRFKKGSGMLIATPVVEMVEIGAGGGSIAAVDAMGRVQVGPRSAGSEPGPACYGRGGTEPTVSDANLILGRLDPDRFAGGTIPLSAQAGERALTEGLGEPAGLDLEEAAFAVTEMVDENMANAARVHTVENGRDVERFAMIAFGGGAPLHAARLAQKLGIDTVLVPPGAGVGSAIGFLRAPFSYEASRSLHQRLEALDTERVETTIAAMREEARTFVRDAAGAVPLDETLTALMRYRGQGWEIPVQLADTALGEDAAAMLRHRFEAAYTVLFGRTIEGLAVEITGWTLRAATRVPEPDAVVRAAFDAAPEGERRGRRFFDAALRTFVDAREVERSALGPSVGLDGPAVIVEDETTTIVPTAFRAVGQGDGSLLLTIREKKA